MTSKNTRIETLLINGLTHDGRGVGHFEGKTIFVKGAVPDDTVTVKIIKHHENFDDADCLEIKTPSPNRVTPFCPVYAECGGCQLQHLSLDAQRHWKNKHFMTLLTQSVDTQQCKTTLPIVGDDTYYRRRARLSLIISKKDKVARLGFKQKSSNDIVDIDHCPVLTTGLNQAIKTHKPALLKLASRAYKEVPLIEADNGIFVPPNLNKNTLQDQPYYTLKMASKTLKIEFPQDGFIQINQALNEKMIPQALSWLNLQPNHKVLDLFCGVGNFTLPIAQKVHTTIGIEGEQDLVNIATHNAKQNTLDSVNFYKGNLFEDMTPQPWFKKQIYDRILLDPGRQGAFNLCKYLGKLKAHIIVYVSCNAATLIRDIKELEKQGYRLTQAGIIDMFPHTTHTEVMVQLTRTHKTLKKPKSKPTFKI
ncbi:23S rRNA (uracil(1939)-C(5))-methyltransferase [hydrothermal vent metagenome]|uniref:23S rRNA (Uracil(1939)-C(5))-methyltransferase n=1 Tax=hydrothermal vent metagenome TaxID=652676 RepID=A0A3B0WER9_9ZZZZ